MFKNVIRNIFVHIVLKIKIINFLYIGILTDNNVPKVIAFQSDPFQE